MKYGKYVIALILVVIMAASFIGCNRQLFDVTYSYERAIIQLPNGQIIDGPVDSWKDYEGDQLQIVINGTTYLVHSSDAVLISE